MSTDGRSVPLAPLRLYRSAIELLEKDQCPSCWLTNSCCMCAQMRGLHMRHKVYMMMHHKEFGRGSNTGKLAVRTGVPLAAPAEPAAGAGAGAGAEAGADGDAVAAAITSTSAIIHTDIALQSRALLDLCNREPLNTVVLFPSKESITIEEFVAQRGWSLPPPRPEYLANATATAAAAQAEAQAQTQSDAGAATAAAPASGPSDPSPVASPSSSPSTPSLPPCPPLNIILLDGTWRQARGLRHLLPAHIPALRIDPFKYRLDGTLRKEHVVDVRAAAEMAAADGESDSLCVEDGSTVAAAAAAAVTAEEKDAASASPPAASTGVASVPGQKGAKTKAKLSQRDAVHREGKKAPKPQAANGSGAPAPTFVSLFYPLRKQSQPDRISTVEALVVLLMELHESPAVTLGLLDLLRVLVDSMRVQCGMAGVYGTYSEEQGRRMRIDITTASAKRTAKAKEIEAAAAAAAVPSDGRATTPAPEGASPVPAVYMSRKQRSLRSNAFKPCMQWNRGGAPAAPCPATPCRFAHCCMLCNDAGHRAMECSLAHAEQSLADALRSTALGGAATPAATSASVSSDASAATATGALSASTSS
jgi:DTW domain-containing protein YfiP